MCCDLHDFLECGWFPSNVSACGLWLASLSGNKGWVEPGTPSGYTLTAPYYTEEEHDSFVVYVLNTVGVGECKENGTVCIAGLFHMRNLRECHRCVPMAICESIIRENQPRIDPRHCSIQNLREVLL